MKLFCVSVSKKQKSDNMKNCLITTKILCIICGEHIINPKKGKSFRVINKLKIDRKVVVDKQEISNSMNEHFCDIGMKLQSVMPDYGYKYMDYMPQRIANSFYLEPIAADDILIEIKRLKHNKSPGHELIGSKVIQLCPDNVATNLSKIYNWGIENGKIPTN